MRPRDPQQDQRSNPPSAAAPHTPAYKSLGVRGRPQGQGDSEATDFRAGSMGAGLSAEIPTLDLDAITTLQLPAIRLPPRRHPMGNSNRDTAAVESDDGQSIDEMPTWILP